MPFAEMKYVRRRVADLPCVCLARRRDDEELRRDFLEANADVEAAATAASSCVSSDSSSVSYKSWRSDTPSRTSLTISVFSNAGARERNWFSNSLCEDRGVQVGSDRCQGVCGLEGHVV